MACYSGDFDRALPDGFGVIIYQHGEEYTGYWRSGQRHGRGAYRTARGTVFEGYWRDGALAVLCYQGEYRRGGFVRHGKGIGYFAPPRGRSRGSPVVVDLSDGLVSTEAVNQTCQPSDTSYNGEWSEGARHGTGVEQVEGGREVYRGEFRDGLRHGQGHWMTEDLVFSGAFANGVPHGVGVERRRRETLSEADNDGDIDERRGEGAVDDDLHRRVVRRRRVTTRVSVAVTLEGTWRRGKPHGVIKTTTQTTTTRTTTTTGATSPVCDPTPSQPSSVPQAAGQDAEATATTAPADDVSPMNTPPSTTNTTTTTTDIVVTLFRNGSIRRDALLQGEYMSDSDAAFCAGCRAPFRVLLRHRHHCRSCGKIFCDQCTPRFASLPDHFDLAPYDAPSSATAVATSALSAATNPVGFVTGLWWGNSTAAATQAASSSNSALAHPASVAPVAAQHRVCMECFVTLSEGSSLAIHFRPDGTVYAGISVGGQPAKAGPGAYLQVRPSLSVSDYQFKGVDRSLITRFALGGVHGHGTSGFQADRPLAFGTARGLDAAADACSERWVASPTAEMPRSRSSSTSSSQPPSSDTLARDSAIFTSNEQLTARLWLLHPQGSLFAQWWSQLTGALRQEDLSVSFFVRHANDSSGVPPAEGGVPRRPTSDEEKAPSCAEPSKETMLDDLFVRFTRADLLPLLPDGRDVVWDAPGSMATATRGVALPLDLEAPWMPPTSQHSESPSANLVDELSAGDTVVAFVDPVADVSERNEDDGAAVDDGARGGATASIVVPPLPPQTVPRWPDAFERRDAVLQTLKHHSTIVGANTSNATAIGVTQPIPAMRPVAAQRMPGADSNVLPCSDRMLETSFISGQEELTEASVLLAIEATSQLWFSPKCESSSAKQGPLSATAVAVRRIGNEPSATATSLMDTFFRVRDSPVGEGFRDFSTPKLSESLIPAPPPRPITRDMLELRWPHWNSVVLPQLMDLQSGSKGSDPRKASSSSKSNATWGAIEPLDPPSLPQLGVDGAGAQHCAGGRDCRLRSLAGPLSITSSWSKAGLALLSQLHSAVTLNTGQSENVGAVGTPTRAVTSKGNRLPGGVLLPGCDPKVVVLEHPLEALLT